MIFDVRYEIVAYFSNKSNVHTLCKGGFAWESPMGNSEHYTASIEVSASPEASFEAVAKQMNRWWTETVEGGLNRIGDTVTAIFPPDFGHWTFEAKVVDRYSVLEMVCIDAHHRVEGQPVEIDREWLGTRIVWRFAADGKKTRITLTHIGLTPQLKCWDICLDGWSFFFKESLKSFLNGEAATPHKAVTP